MSIQTRLTLSFTCLFGIIVAGLAIGSYVLMRNNLYSDLKAELQVAVDGTAMSAEHEFSEHSTAGMGEADLRSVLDERGNAALPDTQILVRQGSRQVAYKPDAQSTIDLRAIPSNQLQAKSLHHLRIASRDLPISKFHSHYQIYAAASTALITQRLRRVAFTLVLLVPVGLLLAASAGYMLARKSLAPLNDLSTTIESVTSSDLGLRVSTAGRGGDEISRIGRRFNSLLNRLQQSFDSQQRFMADASHELRTPVTVALAAAQVTARDPLRTQRDSDEALRLVEVQMLRVKNIVQQLLLLSQADASFLKVNMSDVYLDDIVAEASRAARALANTKQQRLEVERLPEAPIQGDSDLLGQALMILLDNAVKFTPHGGHIQVGIARSSQYWVCYVTDSGIGIPASAQPHVFDRFYRVVDNAAGEVTGSGLGLAIAKVIVEGHRGILTLVESRPGLTRFEMKLLSADSEGNRPLEQDQPSSCAVRI